MRMLLRCLQKRQTTHPRVPWRLFQNDVFSGEISDFLGLFLVWRNSQHAIFSREISNLAEWSWSGEILQMQFLGTSLSFGIGLDLVKFSKHYIFWGPRSCGIGLCQVKLLNAIFSGGTH